LAYDVSLKEGFAVNGALLIHNARLVTPDQPAKCGWLLCVDGKIDRIGYGDTPAFENIRQIDGHNRLLLPGFVDIHVHGGSGHEVMDAQPDTLPELSRFYARHGVTSFLATTWTETRERIQTALDYIAEWKNTLLPGARMLGAHLEGPYLNADKAGAQNPDYVRPATRDEAAAFLDTGVIRLLSLAPEIAENQWLIGECVRRGITVSAAHTSATYDDMKHATALGLKNTTHTYNAMTGLHHRDPGTLGAALAFDELRCELIADNIHVHPGAMKVLYRAKGLGRVILITDAVRPAGLPDGDYPIDNRIISVKSGAARLPDGTLAGSILTMERALRNFATAVGEPVERIWQVSSLNAAKSIGAAAHIGSIEVGKDADLVLVDEQVNVFTTVVQGNPVYHLD